VIAAVPQASRAVGWLDLRRYFCHTFAPVVGLICGIASSPVRGITIGGS
jgi:hypothetical protein